MVRFLRIPSGASTASRTSVFRRRLGHRTALFRVANGREFRTLARESTRRGEPNGHAAILPGGRLLAVAMDDGVGFWDVAHDVALASLQVGQSRTVVFGPSGDLLAEHNKRAVRWRVRVDEGAPGIVRVGPPELLPFATRCVALGGEGKLLAVTQPNGSAVLDLEQPGVMIPLGPRFDVRSLGISPDGRWAVTASHHGTDGVKIWSLPEGRLVKQFANSLGLSPQFSPNGRRPMTNLNLAASCRLWSVDDWREGPRSEGSGLGFSPDGQPLAVGVIGGIVRLIESKTGRVVANPEPPPDLRVNRRFRRRWLAAAVRRLGDRDRRRRPGLRRRHGVAAEPPTARSPTWPPSRPKASP